MPVAPPRVDPPPEVRLDRRAARHDARSVLWTESSLPRLRDCGRATCTPGGMVAFRVTGTGPDRRAGVAGVSTCGSTWACPVCSHKIAVRRAEELTAAVAEAHRRDWHVLMVTVTERHSKGQALSDLWGALGYAWGKVTSGYSWKRDQADYGIHGWVRVVEATHGRHGWHVHIHSLLFMSGGKNSPLDVAPLMFQRWRSALLRKGLEAPLAHKGGLDARMVRRGDAAILGDYFNKATYAPDRIGFEVAAGATKEGRRGNRTPFQILADVVKVGEVRDLALWHEWETISKGKRQLTWSKGIRSALVTEPEQTDEEIVEEDLGGQDVALVASDAWRALTRYRLVPHALTAIEADASMATFRGFMRDHGVPWAAP